MPCSMRKVVGFSGKAIQMLVSARRVRLNGGRSLRQEVYVELHALSNFSFLRGASHPEELVAQASA